MLLSVFTPSHNPRFLDDCYRSLKAQTLGRWEWVVLLNGSARDWQPAEPDERVRLFRAPRGIKGVGAAKRAACEQARGEILVELDHDDVLASTCLERVAAAFEAHPDAVLVFSDFAQVNEDLSPNHDRFSSSMGWVYDEVDVDGTIQLRCRTMEASPHNVSYIWYAPNHVRAFRRTAYDAVGGYDPALTVLDDQDLMMKLYAVGEFHLVDECLYLQRVHSANTQVDPAINAHIQQQTVAMHQDNIEELMRAWSVRKGLAAVTLRTSDMPGYAAPDEEVVRYTATEPRLPYADGSVGVIKAHELLQRIVDRAGFFNECYRVLAHGGMIMTETPSTDGRGAFQDPSHVAFYNENSFWYVTQANLRPSIPGLVARLQISRIRTYFPTPWHEEVHIPYVQANLLAIKDGTRQGGPLLA